MGQVMIIASRREEWDRMQPIDIQGYIVIGDIVIDG